MSDLDLPSSPAALRNRGLILDVLKAVLPAHGRALEVASGTGEHVTAFAEGLPGVQWRPTERSAEALGWIEARRASAGLANLLEPAALDVLDPQAWPLERFDAVVAVNLIHIAPWAAARGLMEGAASVLGFGGKLVLYGPYREADRPLAESNAAFDADLKARDPSWGLRDREAVEALAAASGFVRALRVEMPANNLTLVFDKRL